MQITIKKAAAQDAQAVSELFAKSWKEAYPGIVPAEYLDSLSGDHWTDMLKAQFGDGPAKGLLAFSGQSLAGAAVLRPSSDSRKPDAGEIMCFYVDPDVHRRGVGSILMKEALSALRQEGYPEAFLWVVTGNERAMAFYRHCGFSPDGDSLEVQLGGKVYTDLRYRTQL